MQSWDRFQSPKKMFLSAAGMGTGFPPEIMAVVDEVSIQLNTSGHSDAQVFSFRRPDGAIGYLKVAITGGESCLAQERAVLNWLAGRLPVPQVLAFAEHAGQEYLAMTEIAGVSACDQGHGLEPEQLARLLGRSLRLLHSTDISDCPFRYTLDVALNEAHERLRTGHYDIREFRYSNAWKSPWRLLDYLVENAPREHDLVFTHGDCCLPNIIVRQGALSGFIDLGRGGVADRYRDLALCARSLPYNGYEQDCVRIFLEEYGLDEPDRDKLEFYKLLDKFF